MSPADVLAMVKELDRHPLATEQIPGILRFFGSTRHDAAIERWLDERAGELGSIARTWFNRLRQCGDDVRELLHDYHPTVCVDDAAFAYVNVFRDHVNVGFFHGAFLPDPAGLLEGVGKRMRHVKLRPGVGVEASALDALIVAAYADIKTRLKPV
jgi:hypothetical protein